jgi:hypothetical protein
MLIEKQEIVPDVMGAAFEFGRETDGISGNLLGRGGIDTDFHKNLFEIEGIGSTGANALHIQIAVLIAEIAAVPTMSTGKEEAQEFLQIPSSCVSPSVPTPFPHLLEIGNQTE